jgi:DNA-binding response OmpR family regulator
VFQGALLKLTTTEAQILQYLIQNKNNTITREKLCEALSSLGNTRSLDHHIKNIRKKIEKDSSNPEYLFTEYGVGYKLLCD